MIEVNDIKGAPYNPRTITEEEKYSLRRSMETFRDISGIIFNKRTGNLVGGHNRWYNLKDNCKNLKIKHIIDEFHAIYDGKTFTGYLMRIVDWPKSEEKKANITANSHTASGKFDLDMLPTVLDEIDDLQWKEDIRIDILLDDLKLSFDDWNSDIDDLGNVKADDSPLDAVIKVTCLNEKKDEVTNKIKEVLEGYDQVKIS